MRQIQVSVVYAKTDVQWIKELKVPIGSDASEVITVSKLLDEVTELAEGSISELKLGVYSQPVELDYLMREGDRLEVYRPLKADPKEVRRQLALLGKTMGKRKSP